MVKVSLFSIFFMFQLTGCDNSYTSTEYQMTKTQDGKTYRLNTKTGKVFLIKDTHLFEVSISKETKLIVGKIYISENDEALKYLGSNKFKQLSSDDEDYIEYLIGL